jgi:superfamily II DNA/RNA helicase
MTTFADLGLADALVAAVADAGYTTPTPIQEQAIPVALAGKDVLGIAQTGTGKTAGFVLPMIDILSRGRAKARMPRTLILEPTRELAAQVAEQFDKYGKNHKLTKALLIGGVSFGDQDALLARGVDVLIATPGRLLDHFERGKLLLNGVQIMVIDEADRMLDMGFIPDIERIFKLTPFTRQTLFFSATMPPEIQRLTDQFLNGAVKIEVSKPATASATITQRIVRVPSSDTKTKRTALRAIIDSAAPTLKNGIIFCNRKTDVDIVAKSLVQHGYDAAPIHGDLQQSQRTATLDRFRSGELKILVASDVAARGLDIPDVSHVFNFDVPRHADDYVHRIGRTGRAGRLGEAFMLVSSGDDKLLAAVKKLINTDIEVAEIPGVPTERVPETFVEGRAPRGKAGTARGGERAPRTRSPRTAKPVVAEAVIDESAAPVQVMIEAAPIANESPRPTRRRRGAKTAASVENVGETPAIEAQVELAASPLDFVAAPTTQIIPGLEMIGEASDAPMELVPANSEAEAAQKRGRGPRTRGGRSSGPLRESRAEADARPEQRPGPRVAPEHGSRAFGGDAIPAFLLRPVPVKRLTA